MGGGALVDNPEDVLIIGHPKINEPIGISAYFGKIITVRVLTY
jgi:hypothetical protein